MVNRGGDEGIKSRYLAFIIPMQQISAGVRQFKG